MLASTTPRGRVTDAYRRAVRLADRADAAAVDGKLPSALVPGAWAGLKLALVGLLSPLVVPWVGVTAARNHRQAKELLERFPSMLDEVIEGRPVSYPQARVARASAAQRWFITSDLHRAVPGGLDWPGRQGSDAVYAVALDRYAEAGWGLIENGDVEEYWLVGGSAYGVVYDVARMLAAALPGGPGRSLRAAVYEEHFLRIVGNNRSIYDRIGSQFHDAGRYRRLVGNHDDVYEHPDQVRLLEDRFPGLEVADFLVLESDGRGEVVVTHGHQPDSWNGPTVDNRIARFTSSLGSAVHDLPLFGAEPGLPPASYTRSLLAGEVPDRLTSVNGLMGANTGLESLDEVLLRDGFQRAGPGPSHDVTLVLGHTHIPLVDPVGPDGGAGWPGYVNAGSGITHELVTGVEWDGGAARLVAWGYCDNAPGLAIGTGVAGRPVTRWVLERGDDRLVATPGGAVPAR